MTLSKNVVLTIIIGVCSLIGLAFGFGVSTLIIAPLFGAPVGEAGVFAVLLFMVIGVAPSYYTGRFVGNILACWFDRHFHIV